ncbi:MAG: hypothetical protein BGO98_30025 [Myxococcales bacterium 68-20]|nr:hypothetical protein [Myxococcales bacterium]OJY16508.1 MAG: hypothetical protein BGO98_30025 [Myxococcales bacterium 68-20]
MAEGAVDFVTTNENLEGWPVRITAYRIGAKHYCHVDNVSPGATVARSSGTTADEARGKAVTNARERLAKTVRR